MITVWRHFDDYSFDVVTYWTDCRAFMIRLIPVKNHNMKLNLLFWKILVSANVIKTYVDILYKLF